MEMNGAPLEQILVSLRWLRHISTSSTEKDLQHRNGLVDIELRMISSCRIVLSEAVDGCICFTWKIQHGGDLEQSRPQDPKNVHNFLSTVRHLSWACGHGTEMLLILKKNYFWRWANIKPALVYCLVFAV